MTEKELKKRFHKILINNLKDEENWSYKWQLHLLHLKKVLGEKTHQIFSDKLVVAELVFTQGVGQFNFAGG